jgi:hypothetical protein
MTRLLQPSLTAGEISPSLYARVDTARYSTGLKRCRNFIVRPYGGVENRCGTEFIAASMSAGGKPWRLIPFVYSTEISYVIELGDRYAAFYANGAPIRTTAAEQAAWDAGTNYLIASLVSYGGDVWRAKTSNIGHVPAPGSSYWVQDDRLTVLTPYTADEIWDVRYTQSADILYLVHGNRVPRELRRLTATSFQLALYDNTEGPFRDLNTDESMVMASSGAVGNVTITCNKSIFTADAVGALVYLETKNMGQIKPWVVGDRSVSVGDLRRSDGKTYRATTVPAFGAGGWSETGNRQPIHDDGRAWDGSGDSRTNGSQTWNVGIEWEYLDAGYGIAEITSITSGTAARAIVQKRFPAQVVGSAPAAAQTWTFAGDGGTVYSIPGALDGRYEVLIDGVSVASNPYYQPPPATGGPGGGGGNHSSGGGVRTTGSQIP